MKKAFLIGLFMAGLSGYSYADSMCACNEPPIGKGGEYVTKEYVDSKVAEINSKLDAIESRIAKLKAELGNVGAAPAGLVEKISALESALSDLGKSCPAECNAKLVRIEKDLADLKEKVEKRSANLEKEVEKSMRK